MKDNQNNELFSIISIVIIIQFLGLFAYLYGNSNNSAKPLLEQKAIQVYNQVLPDTNLAEKIQRGIIIPPKPTIIDQLLAEYSTNFNANQTARAANIKLAAQLINNKVLKPGQIFSYNETVGERTAEAGFKSAPVIINKKVSSGIGGGICQVSSTLYNVILESNFEIIERHPHSIPVNYVPKGRDATVAYDYLDFQFKNNSKSYIILKTEVNNGKLTIKIFTLKYY